jgi:hypothetical protein
MRRAVRPSPLFVPPSLQGRLCCVVVVVVLDDASGGAGLTVVCSVVVVLVALSGPQPAVKATMAVSPAASKSCGEDTVLIMINPLIRKTFEEDDLMSRPL